MKKNQWLQIRLSQADLAALDLLAQNYAWQEQNGNRSEAVRRAIYAALNQYNDAHRSGQMEMQHG